MNDFLQTTGMSSASMLFFAIIALVLIILFFGIKIIPEGRAKIVERLGRRHKTLFPGTNFIIPFIDRVRHIKTPIETRVGDQIISLLENGAFILAEQRMDPEGKMLLAKDNSQILVDPIVYFRVKEPAKLAYDVTDFLNAFETLIETTLRHEVGKYDGDTIVTSRDSLGDALKESLREASTDWGIEVVRVEIEDLSFDKEVTQSLSDARQEELKRRATLVEEKGRAEKLTLSAEAKKKAAILEAEGIKEAQILKAQGEFEAEKLAAEAKFLLQSREQEGIAQGFAAISKALKENPEAIVALEALKAQAKVAESIGNSQNTLIVPTETAGLLGAIGSLTKGIQSLQQKNSNPTSEEEDKGN